MRVYLRWSFLPYLISYLLAFMIIGAIDLVEGRIVIESLVDPIYWQEVLLMMTANVLVLTTTMNLYVNKALLKHSSMSLEERQNDSWHKMKKVLNKCLGCLRPSFSGYMHRFNLERKTRAFKRRVHRRLRLVEILGTYTTRELYEKVIGKEENITESDMKKFKKSMYCRTRYRLENQLTQKYITEHVEYLRVHYSRIKEPFIKVGYNDERHEEDMVVESKFKKIFSDHGARFLLSAVIFALVRASFFQIAEELSWAVVFTVLVKFFILVSSFIAGKEYAPVYIEEKLIKDDQTRIDIITVYLEEEEGVESCANNREPSTDAREFSTQVQPEGV